MRLSLLLAVLLPLAACDPAACGDDGGSDTYSVRYTGSTVLSPSLDKRPTGHALFATVGVGLGETTVHRFVVELQDDSADPFLLLDLTFASSAIPAVGTFAADAPDGGAAGKVHVALSQSQSSPSYVEFFEGESGKVTITEASAGRVRGTIDATVRTAGTSAPGGNAVRVQGSFTAIQGHL